MTNRQLVTGAAAFGGSLVIIAILFAAFDATRERPAAEPAAAPFTVHVTMPVEDVPSRQGDGS